MRRSTLFLRSHLAGVVGPLHEVVVSEGSLGTRGLKVFLHPAPRPVGAKLHGFCAALFKSKMKREGGG